MPVVVRPTTEEAARLKGRANRLGQGMLALGKGSAIRSELEDGFLIRATKADNTVIADIIELPGRLEGSNEYRDALDVITGESPINGIVLSASPNRERMSPSTDSVVEVPPEERPGKLGKLHAFGAPLPEDPFLLYNSFPTEFDGGVIFTHIYTDVQPPIDAFGAAIILDQPVWLVVLVRWAGLAASRSVSFSEPYIQSISGQKFYPRHVVSEGVTRRPLRYGARLPAACFANNRLNVAIELETISGGASTIGGMLALSVHFPEGEAALEWSTTVDSTALGADLVSDVFIGGEGPFRAAGYDLPAIFSWVDTTGPVPASVTFVSFRARCRKAVPDSYRLVVGQALLTVVDGVGSVSVDFVDSLAGLDAGFPQMSAAKAYLQKYRDTFFVSSLGLPVRHRRMRVMVRPAADADISPAAPTGLFLHSDRALLRTEHNGSGVNQTQGALGYGPEEASVGEKVNNGGSGTANIGFATPVGVGEVWSWGLVNDTAGTQVGIARLTSAGVAAALAPGLPSSLQVSTYQQEVLDEFGAVVIPMGQVVSVLDGSAPKIAIKKGRFGPMDFIPAAGYSRFGLFYTASAGSKPRYGRVFG